MTAKLTKKIKLSDADKNKDEELQSMTHYIDDRLELVKQIFSTLKPKTVKNLSPEFLKDSTNEEIQELCLNELLGISSKRLKSIITATKCPTDTESSDSNVEENMSLEEISSDSDDGANRRKKGGKNSKTNKDKNNCGPIRDENGKEISVLELLELQARARAIRSQLALEPVAKVELDDEEDGSENKNDNEKSPERKSYSASKSYKKSATSNSRPYTNDTQKPSSSSSSRTISESQASSGHSTNLGKTSRPIKLKRNYGTSSTEPAPINNNYSNSTEKNNYHSRSVSHTRSVSKETIREQQSLPLEIKPKREQEEHINRHKHGKHLKHSSKDYHKDNVRNSKKITDKKGSDNKRSPSPDVLAILPSPEILSVSDSSEEESVIKVKNEKPDESYTESESSSSSESSDTTLSSEESDYGDQNEKHLQMKNDPEKMEDLRNLIQRKKNREKQSEQSKQLTDNQQNQSTKDKSPTGDSLNLSLDSLKNQKSTNLSSSNEKLSDKSYDDTSKTYRISSQEKNNPSNIENTPQIIDTANERRVSNSQLDKNAIVDCEICKGELKNSNREMTIKHDDDHHNDDVISLGDAELDYGISEHIEEVPSQKNIDIPDTPLSPEVNQSEPEEEIDLKTKIDKRDYIDLHDSSSEDVRTNESNSWNDRWLKSSKVSKILAASKLGNKVRDKVKKTKQAEKEQMQHQQQQQQQQELLEREEELGKNAAIKTVLSNFEEGSVKQYEKIKEIIKSPKK